MKGTIECDWVRWRAVMSKNCDFEPQVRGGGRPEVSKPPFLQYYSEG